MRVWMNSTGCPRSSRRRWRSGQPNRTSTMHGRGVRKRSATPTITVCRSIGLRGSWVGNRRGWRSGLAGTSRRTCGDPAWSLLGGDRAGSPRGCGPFSVPGEGLDGSGLVAPLTVDSTWMGRVWTRRRRSYRDRCGDLTYTEGRARISSPHTPPQSVSHHRSTCRWTAPRSPSSISAPRPSRARTRRRGHGGAVPWRRAR